MTGTQTGTARRIPKGIIIETSSGDYFILGDDMQAVYDGMTAPVYRIDTDDKLETAGVSYGELNAKWCVNIWAEDGPYHECPVAALHEMMRYGISVCKLFEGQGELGT